MIVPAAAQVGAVAIAGIHDPDLVAGSQRSGRHGEGPKAVVGEPIVQVPIQPDMEPPSNSPRPSIELM